MPYHAKLVIAGVCILLTYVVLILPALLEMFLFNTRRGKLIRFARRVEDSIIRKLARAY